MEILAPDCCNEQAVTEIKAVTHSSKKCSSPFARRTKSEEETEKSYPLNKQTQIQINRSVKAGPTSKLDLEVKNTSTRSHS